MIDWVGLRTVKQFPRIEDQHFREFVISDTFFRESVNSSKIFPLPRLGRLEISEVALRRVKRLRKFVVLTICSRQRHQISSGSLTFCFVELGQKSFMQRKTTVWKSENTVFSLEVIWLPPATSNFRTIFLRANPLIRTFLTFSCQEFENHSIPISSTINGKNRSGVGG